MTAPRWEVFHGRRGDRRRAKPGTPQVRFARGGTITFNAAAADRLGDLVELLHAPDAAGFRATTGSNPNAYRLRAQGRQKTITAVAFSRHVGHDRTTSVLYDAEWHDGILVVAFPPAGAR